MIGFALFISAVAGALVIGFSISDGKPGFAVCAQLFVIVQLLALYQCINAMFAGLR